MPPSAVHGFRNLTDKDKVVVISCKYNYFIRIGQIIEENILEFFLEDLGRGQTCQTSPTCPTRPPKTLSP